MAGEAFDQATGAGVVEAFLAERGRQRAQAGITLAHRHDAHRGAKHQPIRRLGFCCMRRPGHSAATDQATVDVDGVGPAEGDGTLRGGVHQQCIAQRHHAGVERPASARQRLLRLEHDGEFRKIEAPDVHERPAPSSAAIALACAKASPTSRSVTRWKGGGRSNAGAAVGRGRVCISGR